MYSVYEIFKSDGKRFFLFSSEYLIDCEVYAKNYSCDCRAVMNGFSDVVIEKED